MSALVPSHVGIKKPVVMDEDAQGLKSNTNTGNTSTTASKDAVKAVEGRENTEGAVQDSTTVVKTANGTIVTTKPSLKVQFVLLPNLANDMATLAFNLNKKTDLTLEILNETGQMMLRRSFGNTQTGSLNFDTRDWASGAYFIHLTDGKNVKTVKRLIVQH